MPGYFASSNSTYTDIWALGPRTQQLVCFPPDSQTSTWEITLNGAYIRGQKPATTARVFNLSNYMMTFETMIDHGGTGWRVDTEIDAIQATGPICRSTVDLIPQFIWLILLVQSFSQANTQLVPLQTSTKHSSHRTP